MRLVLASLFQENVSQLSVGQKLRLFAGFTRSFSEPFAQRLLLPDSSYLVHLSRNAGQVLLFQFAAMSAAERWLRRCVASHSEGGHHEC